MLSSEGYQVKEAGSAKDIVIKANQLMPNLILLDMNFSRDTTSGEEGLEILNQIKTLNIPTILMTAWGSIELAVEGLKQGACDFIEKPWNKHKLLNSIKKQLAYEQISQEHEGYRQLLSCQKDESWICSSKSMQDIELLLSQVAPTDANILILGENGTGKSMLARRIHQLSKRYQDPFIAVNMASIPENLFESELFGHQKGAFTDAKQNRIGRFQLAHKGTLFLDEIGTLPLSLQPKLLRVLETGEYEVLGSSQTQHANVRLISATNANLQHMVGDAQFRQDLLYRLNTLTITIPPLRERQDDISLLAAQFVSTFCSKYAKPDLMLTTCAMNKLIAHQWPGNIRELAHVIERAVLVTTDTSINNEQLLLETDITSGNDIPLQPLEEAEQKLIQKALSVSNGQIVDAARLLGISRNALYRRMEKYGIEHES